MPERFGKQVLYGAIYIAIIGGIIAGFYFYFREAPTCFDNRKNQGEQEVDCGGPCESCEIGKLKEIEVENAQAIFVAENLVSLSAEVTNPNSLFGAEALHY